MKHSQCDTVRYDCFIDNKGMVVGAVELMDIIRRLSNNKSPGSNGCNVFLLM